MTELNEIAGADRTDMVAQAASNAAQPRTIERRLVHKSYDENVLVSHIEAIPSPADIAADSCSGESPSPSGGATSKLCWRITISEYVLLKAALAVDVAAAWRARRSCDAPTSRV
jgi:hypothetical protein